MQDTTLYEEKLTTETEGNEQQFQFICDILPELLWITRPDGYHDYFSRRWYEYTGLNKEECMGLGWQCQLHPDDMAATVARW